MVHPPSPCCCLCLSPALQDFTKEVHGVGHRVVHGREISEPVLIR
jgi:acetate kinase